ncbi:MAG: hypothetical protein AAF632_18610 [Bacteroidota bacterium]
MKNLSYYVSILTITLISCQEEDLISKKSTGSISGTNRVNENTTNLNWPDSGLRLGSAGYRNIIPFRPFHLRSAKTGFSQFFSFVQPIRVTNRRTLQGEHGGVSNVDFTVSQYSNRSIRPPLFQSPLWGFSHKTRNFAGQVYLQNDCNNGLITWYATLQGEVTYGTGLVRRTWPMKELLPSDPDFNQVIQALQLTHVPDNPNSYRRATKGWTHVFVSPVYNGQRLAFAFYGKLPW